jgi:hypothetical protein
MKLEIIVFTVSSPMKCSTMVINYVLNEDYIFKRSRKWGLFINGSLASHWSWPN